MKHGMIKIPDGDRRVKYVNTDMLKLIEFEEAPMCDGIEFEAVLWYRDGGMTSYINDAAREVEAEVKALEK